MDKPYRKRNRFYGILLVIFVLVLLYMVTRSMDGESLVNYGPQIAVLPLEGDITSSRQWIEQLSQFEQNKRVAGILIDVDSPGGEVAPSQEIYHAIRNVRDSGHKPVVVSMGSIAASGGFYAAMGADSIFANAGSLTGSIGVIMQFPIYSELMNKIGVGMNVVKSQKFKDAGSPYRPMTDEERRYYQSIIDDVYDQFIAVVSEERGIDETSLHSLAEGQVFTGRQAVRHGLIDGVATFEDVRKIVCQMAGVPEDTPLLYPPKKKRSIWNIIKDDVSSALPGWETSTTVKLEYCIPY